MISDKFYQSVEASVHKLTEKLQVKTINTRRTKGF